MARSNAKTSHCFSAAVNMKDSEVSALDRVANQYSTGDITADYVSAVKDIIAEHEAMVSAIQSQLKTQFSKDDMGADSGNTVSKIRKALTDFMNMDTLGNKVHIVQSFADLKPLLGEKAFAALVADTLGGARPIAFAKNGKAYIIADRIQPGDERAVFLHEVGAHLGLDRLLPAKMHTKLAEKIQAWAKLDDGSIESKAAKAALARADNAGTEAGDLNSEHIAYFIEEAMKMGLNPSATSPEVQNWFRTLWAAFKTAIRALGMTDSSKLNAQDVLNLAYGAARLELNGTWHGTAAVFKKFDHAFISTGEGGGNLGSGLAYGYGTYLGQAEGTGRQYHKDDVGRKSGTATTYNGKVYDTTQDKKGTAGWGALEEDLKRDFPNVADLYYVAEGLAGGVSVAQLKAEVGGFASKQRQAQLLAVLNTITQSGPEGSLMRVDHNVKDTELLDWGSPINQQRKPVIAALEDVRQRLDNAGELENYEEKLGEDYADWTGADLVQRILPRMLVDGLLPAEFDEGLGTKLGEKKVVSKYLESLGVLGSKHLDQFSRNAQTHEYATEADIGYPAKGHFVISRDTTGKIVHTGSYSTEEDARKGVDDHNSRETPATYNHVIFNDKNIQRVASQPAADQSRTKFSKEATAAVTAGLRAKQTTQSITAPAYTAQQNTASQERTIQKLPATLRPAARTIAKAMGRYGESFLNVINFTEDLLNRASVAGLTSAALYKKLYTQRAHFVGSHERAVQHISDMYADLPDNRKGKGAGTANEYLKQTTMQSKWGYQPGYITTPVAIDPEMAAAYKALGAEAQKFVQAILEHGATTLQLKKDTLLDNAGTSYDVLIASAEKAGDVEGADGLKADKAKHLRNFGSLMSLRNTDPYAPLKRFGNFVVMAKSDAYRAAEEELKATGSDKALKALQNDEAHYYVDFVDNDREADKLVETLRAAKDENGKPYYSAHEDGVIGRQKDMTRDQLFGGSGTVAALAKLKGQIDAEYGTRGDSKEAHTSARKLNEMVTELYLSALAESSARKSEMRRKGIAGDIDMVRAFESQGKADANFLGAIKYNEETMQTINAMRQEVKSGGSAAQNTKSKMFNEIMKRHLQSMDYRPSGVSNKLVNLTSKWFLATNPAYYLQNATQPWMMSLPVMASRHGFKESAAALSAAYGDVYTDFKDTKLLKSLDFTKLLDPSNTKLTAPEKAMIADLLAGGRIDIGMATELGSFRIGGDGKASAAWNSVEDGLRGMQTKMEALNRVTTALAAYRLEQGKSGDSTAAAYADRVIADTHGDYNSWNAPRMFNNDYGKIALQFKKYQLIQLSLMAKMLKTSFGDAPAPERAMAKKALMFMFGQAAIVGGVRALPIGALGYAMAAIFGEGDDEPPEYLLRKWVGNEAVADILIGGLPAAVGINSSKFGGMGQMLSVLPFTDVDLTSRKGMEAVGYALLSGPLGGLGLKAADAMGQMTGGNFYKGIELLLPTGFANVMKAGRTMAVGESKRNGDETMSPDEVSIWQTALTGVGIQPNVQAKQQFRQDASYRIEQAMREQGSDIKKDFVQATKNGESTAAIMADWNRYQAKRVAQGFQRQPTSELRSAAEAQSKRVKNTAGNVQFQKDNEEFTRKLATL